MQAPAPPFDLHVLSTPPAFILSQDQTLKYSFVLPEYLAYPLGIGLPLPFTWFLFLKNLLSEFSRLVLVLCCSIIKVLCAVFVSLNSLPCQNQFVKAFFDIFSSRAYQQNANGEDGI